MSNAPCRRCGQIFRTNALRHYHKCPVDPERYRAVAAETKKAIASDFDD